MSNMTSQKSVDATMLRWGVAVVAGFGVWLSGITAAWACSAVGHGIRDVLPADGATVGPEAEFTLVVNGEHTVELTRKSDGATVALKKTKMADALITRDIYHYAPKTALQSGTYTLTAESTADNTASGQKKRTSTYTVQQDALDAGLPDGLGAPSLSVVAFRGGTGGGCGRIGGNNRVRLEVPKMGAGSELPAMVQVEYREKQSASSPGQTDTAVFIGDGVETALEGSTFVRDETVAFTPSCVTVRAWSADRAVSLQADTCGLDRCDRRAMAPGEVDWSTVPTCQGGLPPAGSSDTGMTDGGMPGGSADSGAGNDTGPGKNDAGQLTDSGSPTKDSNGGGCRAASSDSQPPLGLALVVILAGIWTVRQRQSRSGG